MADKKASIIIEAQDRATAAIKSIGKSFNDMFNGVKVFAGTYIFNQLSQQIMQFVENGSKVKKLEQSFQSLTDTYGVNSEKLLNDLKKVSGGMISESDLMEKANKGLLLTSGLVADKMPKLLEIARASAKATGQDVGFLFDSIITGIGRSSPMILDNLGLTVDIGKVNEEYAKSLGKTAEQLTKTESQQALLNSIMKAGDDLIKSTGGSADEAASGFSRLSTATKDLTDELSQSTGPLDKVAGLLADIIKLTTAPLKMEAPKDIDVFRNQAEKLKEEIQEINDAIKSSEKNKNTELAGLQKKYLQETQNKLSVINAQISEIEKTQSDADAKQKARQKGKDKTEETPEQKKKKQQELWKIERERQEEAIRLEEETIRKLSIVRDLDYAEQIERYENLIKYARLTNTRKEDIEKRIDELRIARRKKIEGEEEKERKDKEDKAKKEQEKTKQDEESLYELLDKRQKTNQEINEKGSQEEKNKKIENLKSELDLYSSFSEDMLNITSASEEERGKLIGETVKKYLISIIDSYMAGEIGKLTMAAPATLGASLAGIAPVLAAAAVARGAIQSIKFAEGGSFVTDKPTNIPMSNGRMATVGEAGPERVDVTPIRDSNRRSRRNQSQATQINLQIDKRTFAKVMYDINQKKERGIY